MKITICDRCGKTVTPWEPDQEKMMYKITRYEHHPYSNKNNGWRRKPQMELCEQCADALREFVEHGRAV